MFQMCAISTLMNTPRLKNFVFRNYNLPPSTYSQYPGSCVHELWEVIRASSAAPGYYEDFPLGEYVHSVSEVSFSILLMLDVTGSTVSLIFV